MCQGEADGAFDHDLAGADGADVAALGGGAAGLTGDEIDGVQPAHQRGDGLHRRAQHDLFPVGHAALDAAGVVGLTDVPAVFQIDLVVHAAAAAHRRRKAEAELDPLDRLDAHHGARQVPVQLAAVAHAAAKAALQAAHAHLDDAAGGIFVLFDGVDGVHRPLA